MFSDLKIFQMQEKETKGIEKCLVLYLKIMVSEAGLATTRSFLQLISSLISVLVFFLADIY
jgi:hypothetical protein